MTQAFNSLTWQQYPDNTYPVAPYNLNFASDQSAQFNLANNTFNDVPIRPYFLLVDNLQSAFDITVTYGPLRVIVPAFQRETITLPRTVQILTITCAGASTNVVYVVFSVDRLFNDQIAQYAIQAQVATALAGTALQEQTPIINPAFQVWADGIGPFVMTTTRQYAADAWQVRRGGLALNCNCDQVAGPIPGQYAIRLRRAFPDANISSVSLWQDLLSENCYSFRGSQVTMSWLHYVEANIGSTVGSNYTMSVFMGTGTDQDILLPPTGLATLASANYQCAAFGQWELQTLTFNVPNNATQLFISASQQGTGGTGVDNGVAYWGFQFDKGTAAQNFRTPDIALERIRCAYLYERWNIETARDVGVGIANTVAQLFVNVPFDRKRIVPAMSISAFGDFSTFGYNNTNVCTALVGIGGGSKQQGIIIVTSGAGFANGTGALLRITGANGFLKFDARI